MILIIGESGTGKSRSLKNLDEKETFIIQAIGKPLPFKGWVKKYSLFSQKQKTGNLFISDNYQQINNCIDIISQDMPHIKTVIIDDFQYIMANEFMRRVKEKGFDKFNDIGHNAWSLVNKLNSVRADLTGVVMSHSDQSESGKVKLKTLGKMLDDKVTVEGMFTVVLQTSITDGVYSFITQNNGYNSCKSPEEMFSSSTIDNDLNFVLKEYHKYNNEDLEDLKQEVLKQLSIIQTEQEYSQVRALAISLRDDDVVVEAFQGAKARIDNDTSVQQ